LFALYSSHCCDVLYHLFPPLSSSLPPPPPRSTLFPYTTLFRSRSRLVIKRSAPALARARAICWPSPRLVPVTMATRLLRSNRPLVTKPHPAEEPLSSRWARERASVQTKEDLLQAEQSR